MEEELLVALEKAYAHGASFDDISAALSKQGMDEKIYIVENF